MTDFQIDRAAYLSKYDVRFIASEILSEQAVKDLDADLPSDTHLIFYVGDDGEVLIDALRAYKKGRRVRCLSRRWQARSGHQDWLRPNQAQALH